MRAPIHRPVERGASVVHIYVFAFVIDVDVPIAVIVVVREGLKGIFFLGGTVVLWFEGDSPGWGDGRYSSSLCICADWGQMIAVRHPHGTNMKIYLAN